MKYNFKCFGGCFSHAQWYEEGELDIHTDTRQLLLYADKFLGIDTFSSACSNGFDGSNMIIFVNQNCQHNKRTLTWDLRVLMPRPKKNKPASQPSCHFIDLADMEELLDCAVLLHTLRYVTQLKRVKRMHWVHPWIAKQQEKSTYTNIVRELNLEDENLFKFFYRTIPKHGTVPHQLS